MYYQLPPRGWGCRWEKRWEGLPKKKKKKGGRKVADSTAVLRKLQPAGPPQFTIRIRSLSLGTCEVKALT